jgi:hypothetical protein
MNDAANPGTPAAAPAASAPAAPAAPAAPVAPVAAQTANLPAAGLVVPDYLKAMSGQNMSGQGSVDSLASAAMSIPRVSMRGKKFRFMEGGEEVVAVNDKVRIIIFGAEPESNRFIKTFYDSAYGGANTNNPPTCASDDGVRPSGWIQTPQHNNCAECPKNRFGSATSRAGKPAKACRDSKRLWVAREEEFMKDDKAMKYALQVPVTSLKALAEFGRSMKQMNVPISTVVVEVSMDDDYEFPLISFAAVGFLPQDKGMTAIAVSDKAEWKLNYTSRPALPAAASGQVPNVAAQALPGQPATPAAPADAAPKPPANMNDIVASW